MDKPHLTFLIFSRLILLPSPSDLLIKVFLYVPLSRLQFKGDRAFAVAAPRLWNQLLPDIKSAPSIFLSLDLKRIFILWHFLNFYLWISIDI